MFFARIAQFFRAPACEVVDETSYLDKLIIEAVQVVVDASRHAQAEVDVHVRMWFSEDGDLVGCHLEQLSTVASSAPPTCTTLVRRTPASSMVAVACKYLPVPEFKLAAAARLLPRPTQRMPKLSARDFQIFQIVGFGAQGTVSLALYKPNGRFYGLKMIAKDSLSSHQLAFAFQEQAILRQLEGCAWFVQLRGSFEDSKYLYLVTDFYTGGELRKKIHKTGGLPVSEVKNLAVQLVLAIEELHKRRIVHRDIKPANLLLTYRGELVVSDFGLSRPFGLTAEQQPWAIRDEWRLTSSRPVRVNSRLENAADVTYRKCGTLGYIAPEACRGGPYSYSADVFSVGAVIYEMLSNKLPFGIEREGRELHAVYQAMTTQPIGLNDAIDAEAHDLLLTMLDPNPARRATLAQVKAHPWFSGVDWKTLAQRSHSAPLRPTPGLTPFDDETLVSFGTPYGPGEAPHFWYDYFSPSLPTEVPTKKSQRKHRASAKKTAPPTMPTSKTSEVPAALSAMFATPAPSRAPSPAFLAPSGGPSPAFLGIPAGTPTLCGSGATSATAVSYDSLASDVYCPSPVASSSRSSTPASESIGAVHISPILDGHPVDYTSADSEASFLSIDLASQPSYPPIMAPTTPAPIDAPNAFARTKELTIFRRTFMALQGVKVVRRRDDRPRRVDLLA